MPTFFTKSIQTGKAATFADFAILCSSAFDRQYSTANTQETYEPVLYHKDKRDEALTTLSWLAFLSEENRLILAKYQIKKEQKAKVKAAKEDIKKAAEIKVKYGTMLLDVMLWKPPTEDHERLQRFMVEQILICGDECDAGYSKKVLAESAVTPDQWLVNAVANAEKDFFYHDEEWEKELARTADRNEFIKQLRGSLTKD